jgi:hypothetical protein
VKKLVKETKSWLSEFSKEVKSLTIKEKNIENLQPEEQNTARNLYLDNLTESDEGTYLVK